MAKLTEAKRNEILIGALKVFSKQGFDNSTLPEIAETANVGLATIYRYFSSKNDLRNGVYQWCYTLMQDRVFFKIDLCLPAKLVFSQFFEKMIQVILEYPEAYEYLENHYHGEYLSNESLKIEEQTEAPIYHWIKKQQEIGIIKSLESPLILALIKGSMIGLFRYVKAEKIVLNENILESYKQSCWEAIRE